MWSLIGGGWVYSLSSTSPSLPLSVTISVFFLRHFSAPLLLYIFSRYIGVEGESPGGGEYVRVEGGVHHSNPYSVPLSPASALKEQQEEEEEEEEGGTGPASGGGGSKGRVYTSSGIGGVVGGISNRGENIDDDIIGADEGNAGSVSTTGIRINSGGSTDDYGGGSGAGAGVGKAASRVFDLDPPIMKGDVVDFLDRKSGQRRRGVVDFIYDRIGEVDVKVLPDGATTGEKGGKLHTGIKSSSVTVRMRPDSVGAGGSGGCSGGGAVGSARAGVHSMRVWDPFGYGGGASSSGGKGLHTRTTGSTGNEGNRGSGGNAGKGIVHYQAALLTSTGGGDTGSTGRGTGEATPSGHGDRGDGVDGEGGDRIGDTGTHVTGESAKVVRQRAVRGDAEATVSSLARQAALSERGWGVGPQQQRYWPATGLTKAVRSITQMHLCQGTMAQAEPLIQVRSEIVYPGINAQFSSMVCTAYNIACGRHRCYTLASTCSVIR